MNASTKRTRLLAGLAGALSIITIAASDAPAQAANQPAKGVVIQCDRLGRLTGKSGHLIVQEPFVPDHGHGHVYFTVMASNVVLTGPDGATYHLYGGGYDDVLRTTLDGHSPILREHEQYRFDVLTSTGVVGEIRFTEHQGADGKVHAHDRGDCHLPKSDT